MAKTASLVAATLAAWHLCLSPAHALSNRAWVSGHGTDAASCGAPAEPCRSLQYVHNNIIAAGGEIDVLDPAGFGPVTITKALSIVNDGVGVAGVQQATSGANAITVNAGSTDIVTLRGLNIDGLNAGQSGIAVNSVGAIQIVNCVIRHFTLAGVSYEVTSSPPVQMIIADSILSDNGGYGIFIQMLNGGPITQPAEVNKVTLTNNGTGIFVGYTAVIISNSEIANNNTGVSTELGAGVRLAKDVIFGNTTGVNLSGGTVYSYGDNYIDLNTTDITGGSLTSVSTR